MGWHAIKRVAVAAMVTGLTTAIVLAVVDISLTGHGRPPLGRPWLSWPAAGVALSRADVILLLAVTVAGGLAVRRSSAPP